MLWYSCELQPVLLLAVCGEAVLRAKGTIGSQVGPIAAHPHTPHGTPKQAGSLISCTNLLR